MRRIQAITALALTAALTFTAGGCSRPGGSAAGDDNQVQAVIATTPKQPIAKQETAFRVEVTERDRDVPIADARVTMYLEMKEMDHGENRVELLPTGDGAYAGKGTFPMEGEWEAVVRVEQGATSRNAHVGLKVLP